MKWLLLIFCLSLLSITQSTANKIFEYDDFINYLDNEFNNSAQLQSEFEISDECTRQMQFWVWTLENRPEERWAAKSI